jgi:hypothetical protein
MVRAAAEPWAVRATLGVGSVPYTWEYHAGGHRLAASIAVRLAHPDGRSAVACWTSDQIEAKTPPLTGATAPEARKVADFPTPIPPLQGPKLEPIYGQAWQSSGAWRWRRHPSTRYPVDIPRAVDVLELRAEIGDGRPVLTLVNAPATEAELEHVPTIARKARPMAETDPDAWVPDPIAWHRVAAGDLFLDPAGRPWFVTDARDVPGGRSITAMRAGETRSRVMIADETVRVLVPLADRAVPRMLGDLGVATTLLERTVA